MPAPVHVHRSVHGQILAPDLDAVVMHFELDGVGVKNGAKCAEPLTLDRGIVGEIVIGCGFAAKVAQPIMDDLLRVFLKHSNEVLARQVVVLRIVEQLLQVVVGLRGASAGEKADQIPRRILQRIEAVGAPDTGQVNRRCLLDIRRGAGEQQRQGNGRSHDPPGWQRNIH